MGEGSGNGNSARRRRAGNGTPKVPELAAAVAIPLLVAPAVGNDPSQPDDRALAGEIRAQAELEIENIEAGLLLEGLFEAHGYDFRGYSRPSLKRRLHNARQAEGVATLSELQGRVLHDREALERLLAAIGVHTTALFRDPALFQALRLEVLPLLRTYPSLRVWCAGCSTGEEVYSLAILLEEEGLYERTQIYATDMSEVALQQARDGVVPLSQMQGYTKNYQAAGGKASLSEYYTAAYDRAIFRESLKRNITFWRHWLTSDWVINTFHLVFCRNVLIYFGPALRDRVFELLYESTEPLGFLALGEKESMRLSPFETEYAPVARGVSLYRRVAR